MAGGKLEFPFLIGHPLNKAKLLEVIVHRNGRLEDVPMRLAAEPLEEGAEPPKVHEKRVHGAVPDGSDWKLTHPRSGLGLITHLGQMYRLRLSVKLPPDIDLDRPATIEIFQRNEGRLITGSVQLVIVPERDER
jgi:hypothetical protein